MIVPMSKVFIAASAAEKDSLLHNLRELGVLHLMPVDPEQAICDEPTAVALDGAKRAEQIMVREMKKYTPDVRQEAPPALMRRWYKDAEPVYDRFGELVPWEPEQ